MCVRECLIVSVSARGCLALADTRNKAGPLCIVFFFFFPFFFAAFLHGSWCFSKLPWLGTRLLPLEHAHAHAHAHVRDVTRFREKSEK